MDTKHALASKTVWVQIVTILSLLVPVVRDWLASNPVEFVSVLAAVNVIVRFVTRGKISVFAGEKKTTESGGSGGLTLLIVWGTAAGLCFTALPSCSLGEYPISGSVTYRDDASGAKAGITFYPPARKVRASK